MNLISIAFVLASIVAICLGAPRKDQQHQDHEDENEGNDIIEGGSDGDDHSEPPPLTPNQYGRLARFNGNFFRLYGNTEQYVGNIEALSGNQLNYRGDLIEFLGNEHSMRSAADYLQQVQQTYYEDAKQENGRKAEILKEQGDLGGELTILANRNADYEHDQAVLERHQLDSEIDQTRLEKQQAHLEAQQANIELDETDVEEKQFDLERQFGNLIRKHMELEEELQQLENPEETANPEVTDENAAGNNEIPESPVAPAPATAPSA